MSFDQQDVLDAIERGESFDRLDVIFDILERNEIKEVRERITRDGLPRWIKGQIVRDILPKSKSAILDEDVIHEASRFDPFDFSYLLGSVCEDIVSGKGKGVFLITYVTEGRKLIVDRLSQV